MLDTASFHGAVAVAATVLREALSFLYKIAILPASSTHSCRSIEGLGRPCTIGFSAIVARGTQVVFNCSQLVRAVSSYCLQNPIAQ